MRRLSTVVDGVARGCWTASALLYGLLMAAAAAESPEPVDVPIREIFVPLADLDVLLGADAQRVFVTRQEYRDLLARTRQPEPETPAPREVVVLSAVYDVALAGERAVIKGRLQIDVLERGLQVVPLPLEGVGLRSAELDGEAAVLGRDEAGTPRLFLETIGRHELVIEATMPVVTSAAQQSVAFRVPTPAATRITVSVPGNVEIQSGALSREFDEAAGVTRFEVPAARGSQQLVMSLNNRTQASQRVVTARSVLVDEVTQGDRRLHATVSMQVLRGAASTFVFRLPAELEVTEVAAPEVSQWRVLENDQGRVLEVQLHEPATGRVTLTITAAGGRLAPGPWAMQQIEPLEVVGHVAVLGLLLDERLEAEGAFPIDVSVLRQAVPASVLAVDSSAAPVRPVAAWLSAADGATLSAELIRPEAAVDVNVATLFSLDEQQQRLRSTITVSPRAEPVHAITLEVPAGWDVTRVLAADGSPLAFAPAIGGEAGGVRVRFSQPVQEAASASLSVEAVRVPDGWLTDWTEQTVGFPMLSVAGGTFLEGAAAITATGDLAVRPAELDGLIPLARRERREVGLSTDEGTFAYRVVSAGDQASFAVVRRQPWMTARTFTFATIGNEALSIHAEVLFTVDRAATRQLSFRLPLETPPVISLRGLGDVVVSEFSSREEDGSRVWTAELADRVGGAAGLAIDFQQPLKLGQQPEERLLPCVVAEGVAYQSAAVAVEGNPEIGVTLSSSGRSIDVGELVDAEYQVGRRLLGVFGFTGNAEVTATISRRKSYPLPEAIVQRAELVTLQGTAGTAQTAVRCQLRTNAAFLQVTLPAGASLWSVSIDGRPSLPQRDGDAVLVSLPPATGGAAMRDVAVVYESDSPVANWWQDVALEAPRLAVRHDSGPAVEVPVADVVWQLVVPDGMRMVRSGGSVAVSGGEAAPWPLSDLGEILLPIAGGLQAFTWKPLLHKTLPLAAARRLATDALDASRPEAAEEAAPAQPSLVAGKLEQLGEAPSSGTALPQAPPVEPPASAVQRTMWAFEGVRSLPIALDDDGTTYRFQNLGGETRLSATLIDERRLVSGSVGLVATVVLCGLAVLRCRWKARLTMLTLLVLAAVATPTALELALGFDLHAFFEPACLAAVVFLPVFVVVDAARLIGRGGLPAERVSAAAIAVAILLGPGHSRAEEQPSEPNARHQFVDMADLLEVLRPTAAVAIPENAVVIPYDPEQPRAANAAEKVLVPYEHYTRLKKRAADMAAGRQQGGPPGEPPPAPFAFGGARYSARLAGQGDLVVSGRIQLMVYAEGVVEVPLPVAGGVFASATLDGRPARLRLIEPQVATPVAQAEQNVQARQQIVMPAEAATPLLLLTVDGVGRHELAVDIRFSPSQRGGWRRVAGRLPAPPATAFSLRVPSANTEVRLAGVLDQATHETGRADELIETALLEGGVFGVEWRSRVAAATIDEALTADSLGIFDVREDGLQLTWKLSLDIRQGQRDTWRLVVPADVLVEEVRGANVRGWDTRGRDGSQQIDVTLLEPATGRSEIVLRLSQKANLVFDSEAAVDLPFVSVPEAALHQGSVVIRRGPLIDLRVDRIEGFSREETPAERIAGVLQTVHAESPLPLRLFQSYRFASERVALQLRAGGARSQMDVEEQTLLRIADRETSFETLLACTVEDRPRHAVEVQLPEGVAVDAVSCPGLSSWSLNDEDRILRIDRGDGALGPLPITLRGRLQTGKDAAGATDTADTLAAPSFVVSGGRRQSGAVVVQVDPSMRVEVTELVDAEAIPVSRTFGWLSEAQRPLARLAIAHRGASFAARVRVTKRQPVVSSVAVTNVRITARDIEETMLLRFQVREAGIREVVFLAPESMADAEVEAPLLLEKIVEPVADVPSRVRIRLTFQDDVMGSLAVLLHARRGLPAGEYRVPMAAIETGTTQQRYAVVETGGRDEVLVSTNRGFRELNRQAAEWRELASILPGQTSMAYVARHDEEEPQLELSLRKRALVEAAGARIGLAITVLTVDAHGEYRGSQEYRVDNKTEQLLEVQLPQGATLWSARVAGQSVKPTPLPGAEDGRRVGIPLIKTQAGDLDYGVVLTYGGNLGSIASWQTVGFPLLTTLNINVEQSQVRLRLPETFRWFDFGGTLRRADSADDLVADFMAYQNKKLEQLLQVASAESNDLFSRVRASTNARQLGESLRGYREAYRSSSRSDGSEKLRKALDFNETIVDEAKSQQAPLAAGLGDDAPLSNSMQLRAYFGRQDVQRGQNVVNELGANFDTPGLPPSTTLQSQADFKGIERGFGLGQDGQQVEKSKQLAQQGQAQETELRDQVQRYQQRLERRGLDKDAAEPAAVAITPDNPMAMPADGLSRRLVESGTPMGSAQQPGAASGLGFGGMGGVGGGSGGGAFGSGAIDAVGEGRQAEADGEQVALGAAAAVPQARGLASLDVQMPERGQEFLFTTPRGDLEITARAVDARWLERGLRIATVLGVGLGLFVVLSLVAAVWKRLSQRVAGLLLLLTGMASVATLVLPFVGIIAAVVGGTLLVASFRRRRAAIA